MTKQEAIERLKEFCKLRAFCELYPDACQKDKCEIYLAIEALSDPSRQGQRDGLISRQAAIDTVVDAMMSGADADMVEGLIYILPSAQPSDEYERGWKEGREALEKEIWEDERDRLD